MKVRLISHPKKRASYHENGNEFIEWKENYKVPLRYFLVLMEVILIFVYIQKVLAPSTMISYFIRKMLVSLFFLEKHESPISNSSQLNEYYESIHLTAASIKHDFMLNVSFPNDTKLVYNSILFSNGSLFDVENLYVDSIILKNVVTITTDIPLFIYSSRKAVPGCSQWDVKLIVSRVFSDPAFFLSSKIFRMQCPQEKASNTSNSVFYRYTLKIILPFILICCFHLLFNKMQISESLALHRILRKEDQSYKNYKGSTQLHYSVGLWLPIETFVVFLSMVSGIILIIDLNKMTEIPSLSAMEMFSISSAGLFLMSLQWFKNTPYSYHFIKIIRDGSGMMFGVLVGFSPIICAFFLAGVFIFAHVAPKTRSMWSMIEILISFTLGDNIQPTYVEFTDGTDLFNWLAFGYVTLMVLVAGWVVFASFTATIAFVHRRIVLKEKQD